MEVFVTSPWVPPEWIKAHGLNPRGVWIGHEGQTVAVPEGVCAFAQSVANLIDAYPHPAIIFTTACDQMRRAADAVAKGHSSHFLFNLPATWQTPVARRLYHTELARLGQFLETLGGRAPTQTQLESSMREYEAERTRLCGFLSQSSALEGARALTNFYADGTMPSSLPPRADAAGGTVPLALVGGPLLPSQWTVIESIETTGGTVVLNATEPGERCLLPPLPRSGRSQSSEVALADHYFDHAVDVFHRPNSRLYAWLRPRLAERCVRGLVLWVHVGCDLWRAEAASLREAFGLPLLVLESSGVRAGGVRETNRVAAFVESLQ